MGCAGFSRERERRSSTASAMDRVWVPYIDDFVDSVSTSNRNEESSMRTCVTGR